MSFPSVEIDIFSKYLEHDMDHATCHPLRSNAGMQCRSDALVYIYGVVTAYIFTRIQVAAAQFLKSNQQCTIISTDWFKMEYSVICTVKICISGVHKSAQDNFRVAYLQGKLIPAAKRGTDAAQ